MPKKSTGEKRLTMIFFNVGVTNVKLTNQQQQTLYGELTIGDLLVAEANKTHGSRLARLTQDLAFDHWAFLLNNHLRETVQDYLQEKTAERKENLKRLIKDIDDNLVPKLFVPFDGSGAFRFGDQGLLHVMFYSFVQPVQIMCNNVTKQVLPKLRDQFNLLTYEKFITSGEEEAKKATDGKVSKGVTVSQS